MSNVFHLPHSDKPPPQRAAYQRLVTPLDERTAMLNFAAKRQQYFVDPCHDNEIAMLAARDAWNVTYQAAKGGGR